MRVQIPMGVKVVVLVALACLTIATAPSASADEGGDAGSCVWTSQHGTSVSAGYNVRDCKSSGGTWAEDP